MAAADSVVQVPVLQCKEKEAGARIRTADLLITNQLLYRLSYASVEGSAAGAARDRA